MKAPPPHTAPTHPTLQEVDELCAEWEPEPLAPPLSEAQQNWREPVVSSDAGRMVRAPPRPPGAASALLPVARLLF